MTAENAIVVGFVNELRVELFGNPQGAAGCDPVSYYIEIGDSVSMDASLDVLNSDLNLTCFGDSTSQIEIKVFDTFVDDTGFPLPGSNWGNSYLADISTVFNLPFPYSYLLLFTQLPS